MPVRASGWSRGRGVARPCAAALALVLACLGCSGDDAPGGTTPQSGSGGGAAGQGGGAGGSGQGSAGSGGSHGGGTGAAGDAGSTASGSGGSAAGGAGGVGGAAGAGGTGQTSDPCEARPPSCFPVCQAGQCQCECPDADPCPASEPAQDAACNTLQLCGYGEPACHRIFECFTGVWKKVADTCADGPTGSCPATMGEALATTCVDRRCGYDAFLCQCTSPACSGVFMEPTTMCFGTTAAACLDPPVEGADCLPEGQRCGATCCGQQFTCTQGKWTSAFIPCPP